MKLGLIVNPIAGMGGRVALKGTDGGDAYRKAVELGAQPQAHRRAVAAVRVIADAMPQASIVACAGAMGEDAARAGGLSPVVVEGESRDRRGDGGESTPGDTRRAALEMQRRGVDLLLFAGGDGTARDIYGAVGSGASMAALGIPAGVKMHSGVFALTPRRAGEIALRFLNGDIHEVQDTEVMDIDEDAFRDGRVSARLYGYLSAPRDSEAVQSTKSGGVADDGEATRDIARQVVGDMEGDTVYIIGTGSTTAAISDALGVENTLLGVDVVMNGRLIGADVSERELLELTRDKRAKIVVGVIGGQGYIFGRGNQQVSPQVIRQVGLSNIIVVATRGKLLALGGKPLLVDTGDGELDGELSGYMEVITGYRESHIYKVSC